MKKKLIFFSIIAIFSFAILYGASVFAQQNTLDAGNGGNLLALATSTTECTSPLILMTDEEVKACEASGGVVKNPEDGCGKQFCSIDVNDNNDSDNEKDTSANDTSVDSSNEHVCAAPLILMTNEEVKACEAKGGVVKNPENGCGHQVCSVESDENTENNNNTCDDSLRAVSENKLNVCISNGGKMVYRKNSNGCEIAPVCVYNFQRQPQLNIGPNGNFLARGMVVKEIDESGKIFKGEVWGTVWKIDASDARFFLRSGVEKNVSDVIRQLYVGEEVGVSGNVIKGKDRYVKARVVRNYNILKERAVNAAGIVKKVKSNVGHHAPSFVGGAKNVANNINEQIQNILKQIEAIRAQIKAQQ